MIFWRRGLLDDARGGLVGSGSFQLGGRNRCQDDQHESGNPHAPQRRGLDSGDVETLRPETPALPAAEPVLDGGSLVYSDTRIPPDVAGSFNEELR